MGGTDVRPPDTARLVREAMQFDNKAPALYHALAGIMRESKDMVSAIKNYHATLRLAPKNVEAHNGLGEAFKEAGKLEDAEASFRTATEVDPKHASSYASLGS